MFQNLLSLGSEIQGTDPDFINQYCEQYSYEYQYTQVTGQSQFAE